MTADRLDSMKVLAVVKVMDEGRETRHVTISENNGAKCSLIVLENQPATRKKSDVQGFMNDSGPKLSPEHDRLSWTGVRFGQLLLIGANWPLISVFPNLLIF